ncbi:TetR/AcrR family transcriptional regulator [Gordonia polyisoprenivorans]|uniref:TetR/AcrR family transcriptional regulator n=1 Tax=Gordonia polyisoprenivorans TaxID=84595 RepID=UPI001AD66592|nr:TetR/AcrR family transcriptional regulator [Gordonia polyisoprenivorans]QTI69013.1 TetR/AcrR family transcriptional regulator [Gordonia polyisoprenivorans]
MRARAGRTAQDYFDAAYGLLAEGGYGKLKLADLCERMGVTTGGFYHCFKSWSDFTRQFLDNWHRDRTTRLIDTVAAESDPRKRLSLLLETAASLPHKAEAAIRVWSTTDRDVEILQRSVDLERKHIVTETFRSMSLTEREAHLRATTALYLVIGHELSGQAGDSEALRWSLNALINTAPGSV